MLSPILEIRRMRSSQTQKEVTFNEAVNLLEAAIQLTVLGVVDELPGDAEEGDRYIIGIGSGELTGQNNEIACYYNGWLFLAPREGWIAYDQDSGQHLTFKNLEWVPLAENAPAPDRGKTELLQLDLSFDDYSMTAEEFTSAAIAHVEAYGNTLTSTLSLPPDAKGLIVVWFDTDEDNNLVVDVAGSGGLTSTLTNGEKALLHTDGENVRRALS